MEKTDKLTLLLAKLRTPLSVEYISNNILNSNTGETIHFLNELIGLEIIEKNGDYYQIKRRKYDN